MNYLELFILSLVQGVAEWLPVSSEGLSMFIMLNALHKEPSQALSYAVFFHIGTMLAVLFRFRKEFIEMLNPNSKLLKIVAVSTIFTAFTAIPLLSLIKGFKSGELVTLLIGAMLILTGVLLRMPKEGYRNLEELKLKDMVMLGLAQGFAILPGISRSGTTISLLLLRRVREEHALKVSFIISVPAVVGAAFLEGLPEDISLIPAVLTILTTFVVGYATMDLLLRFARKVKFSVFCISLGLLTIGFALITGVY